MKVKTVRYGLNLAIKQLSIMEPPVFNPQIDDSEAEEIEKTLQSGWISSSGQKTGKFEEEIKNFLDCGTGFSTDSGTAALFVALKSLGVSKGDKVLVPGLTFGATALAVKQAGAEPVPVDIERETMGIDPDRLEEIIGPDTAAIIVVHLFGKPAKIDQILEIAEEEDVPVVEDSAQAFGSEYRGEKTGTIGDIGVFSFSWNKTLTTGKGGFLVTGNSGYREQIEALICNGISESQKFRRTGYNYRMDSVRASIGLSQLQKYPEISERKKRLREYYRENLEDFDVRTMQEAENEDISPWALYMITDRRDRVETVFRERGIGSRSFYPPVSDLGIVSQKAELPVSREISRKGVILPSSGGIQGKNKVIEAVESVFQ